MDPNLKKNVCSAEIEPVKEMNFQGKSQESRNRGKEAETVILGPLWNGGGTKEEYRIEIP